MQRPVLALVLLVVWTSGMPGAAARPPDKRPPTTCDLIETAAAANGLSVEYFTRLIWKESSFRTQVVSPVGAQGIAQFMPGTAAERGLADPFDPHQAIPASAQLLKALAERFGNLGLAAAAYNSGPQRVADWLAGSGGMPGETRNYVAAITGRTVEEWQTLRDDRSAELRPEAGTDEDEQATCLEVLAALDATPTMELALEAPEKQGNWQPWGVQLAGNFSQSKALATYRNLQQRYPALLSDQPPMIVRKRNLSLGPRPMVNVRVPAPTREAANDICRRLREEGAMCIVLKN